MFLVFQILDGGGISLGRIGGKGERRVGGVCGGGRRIRAAVEKCFRVDEDFARAGSAGGADHAALLEEIHDARGVVVADAHAALEMGDGGPFRVAHDLERATEEGTDG